MMSNNSSQGNGAYFTLLFSFFKELFSLFLTQQYNYMFIHIVLCLLEENF